LWGSTAGIVGCGTSVRCGALASIGTEEIARHHESRQPTRVARQSSERRTNEELDRQRSNRQRIGGFPAGAGSGNPGKRDRWAALPPREKRDRRRGQGIGLSPLSETPTLSRAKRQVELD